jgi:hypothetical protein
MNKQKIGKAIAESFLFEGSVFDILVKTTLTIFLVSMFAIVVDEYSIGQNIFDSLTLAESLGLGILIVLALGKCWEYYQSLTQKTIWCSLGFMIIVFGMISPVLMPIGAMIVASSLVIGLIVKIIVKERGKL